MTSTVFEVDMARKQDYAKIDVFFNSLKTCQTNVLQIHYAFSHIKFSQNSTTCNVLVEVTGELSETEKSKNFICKMNALQKIDWLQSDLPLDELENSEDCEPVTEAR